MTANANISEFARIFFLSDNAFSDSRNCRAESRVTSKVGMPGRLYFFGGGRKICSRAVINGRCRRDLRAN